MHPGLIRDLMFNIEVNGVDLPRSARSQVLFKKIAGGDPAI